MIRSVHIDQIEERLRELQRHCSLLSVLKNEEEEEEEDHPISVDVCGRISTSSCTTF